MLGKSGTKFWAVAIGIAACTLTAVVGRFTGEFGFAVGGMVCTFITGNAVITRAAIQAKAPEGG